MKLNYATDGREALYASLDSGYFTRHTLSELVEQFYLRGGKHLFLDEILFQPDNLCTEVNAKCRPLAYQHRVEYCTRSAYYTIDRKYVIETGGKSKDGKQIASEQTAFIAADDMEYALGNKIPLWAFGFLY